MALLNVPIHIGLYEQSLYLVANGGYSFVPFVVKPFEIVEASDGTDVVNVIGENRSTKVKYRYYDRMPYIPMESHPDSKNRAPMLKPQFDYILSMLKEFPDSITELFPEGVDIYPMFVDIETTSLSPKTGTVLSIQIAYPDTEYDKEIFLRVNDDTTEKDIILQFIEYCKLSPSGRIPDICVNFNGCRFDIPYLHERARTNQILTQWNTMARAKERIFTQSWLINKNQDEMLEVANGFRCYDMYTLAKADLSLAKLPSRTQKNVALFYGCQDVFDLDKSEKLTMMDLLRTNPERFEKYARSDIKQLKFLWDIYSTRTAAEANLLKVPFMTTYAMSSGQKSYIALYREARRSGYYGLSTNIDRYPELFGKGKYQGAIVGSWAHGYYDKIIYVDAKSMYPSIMESFNLSPDRYQLLATIPYSAWTNGRPDVIRSEGTPDEKIIYIPDDNFQVIFKFKIDLMGDGYMRRVIKFYNKIRDEYKQLMKKYKKDNTDEAKAKVLQYDAMQMAAKVINNTYYGINGNRYYEIGDLPQAIFVTAMGRWCMTELIKYFGGTFDYPADDGSIGDTVLEVDTDGLLIRVDSLSKLDNGEMLVKVGEKQYTIDDINIYIRKRMMDVFSVPEDKLTFLMEFEGAGSIYVYKQKNYILRADENNGKLTIKGSSFVGYDKAPIIKKAVNIMADCVMFKTKTFDEAVAECRDMNKPLDEFKYTKTLKRDPGSYRGFESLENYIMNISSTHGTKKALDEMKSRAREWIRVRTVKNDDLKRQATSLIRDAINHEELSIVIDIVSEMVSGKTEKQNSHYLLDLVMAYKQKGFTLREDDIIEYYLTTTKEGYSVAEDVTSIGQVDVDRYLKDINRIIERFDYANPIHSELSLW